METTLTINIPPPERIRAAKGERLREKQMEKDPQGRPKEREKEDENAVREKEGERVRKEEREREREKLERERRVSRFPCRCRSCLMSFWIRLLLREVLPTRTSKSLQAFMNCELSYTY